MSHVVLDKSLSVRGPFGVVFLHLHKTVDYKEAATQRHPEKCECKINVCDTGVKPAAGFSHLFFSKEVTIQRDTCLGDLALTGMRFCPACQHDVTPAQSTGTAHVRSVGDDEHQG